MRFSADFSHVISFDQWDVFKQSLENVHVHFYSLSGSLAFTIETSLSQPVEDDAHGAEMCHPTAFSNDLLCHFRVFTKPENKLVHIMLSSTLSSKMPFTFYPDIHLDVLLPEFLHSISSKLPFLITQSTPLQHSLSLFLFYFSPWHISSSNIL